MTATSQGKLGSSELGHYLSSNVYGVYAREARQDPFCHGRVIVVRENDYRNAIFNGDVGVILSDALPREENAKKIYFPHKQEGVALTRVNKSILEPLHAMTIHRSQGSEYDDVMVLFPSIGEERGEKSPMAEKIKGLLTPNLLYTAFSRGRKNVYFMAEKKLIEDAFQWQMAKWDESSVHSLF